MREVTELLNEAAAGSAQAARQLLPLVYDELKKLASAQMASERQGHTLDATALVHEAYLRVCGGAAKAPGAEERRFTDRRHFYAAAAQAMRRILVDSARRRRSLKRGGGQVQHDVDALELAGPEPREDLLALDEALEKLARADPQAAEVVSLHYFTGLTLLEAAEVLNVSPRTAHHLWAYARAYLHRELQS